MSECEHETIGFWRDDDGRSIPYCTNPKCGASGEQLVSELQQIIADRDATIASQERQLEAAADDIDDFMTCYDDNGNCICPMTQECDTSPEPCRDIWRKRWKNAADKHVLGGTA